MSQSSAKSTRKTPLVLFIGCYLFLFWIMWCTPLYLDDYEFKSLSFSGAGEFVRYILQYGNGRILGNVSSILLVHSTSFAAVIQAFLLSSVIFLVPALLELKETKWYLASFLLFIAIDPLLFGEIYTWISGFFNYIPPVWMTLVIAWLLKGYPKLPGGFARGLVCAAVFLLGTASQLYVEHTSLINVLLALLAVAYFLRRDKARLLPGIFWLLGTVLGIAVMFLTPVLFYVENNRSTGYRSFNLGGLKELILSCFKNALKIGNHYYGTTALPLGFGALVTTWLTRKERTGKANSLLYAATALSMFYVLFGTALKVDGWYGELALVQHGLMFLSIAVPFALWFFSALKLEKALRVKILTLLALAFFSLVPLLVVNPVPVRIIFQSYLFVTAALLLCLKQGSLCLDQQWLAAAGKLCAVACAAMVLMLGILYGSIHSMNALRQRYIDREIAAGNTQLIIFDLPYEYAARDSNGGLEAYYRVVMPQLQFIKVDFDDWMNDILPTVDP